MKLINNIHQINILIILIIISENKKKTGNSVPDYNLDKAGIAGFNDDKMETNENG